MPRGRTKRRGLHQSGYKADWEHASLDMCPYCYSFGCDPFAMSQKFRAKIENRRRQGLCPCCGEPLDHCKCKSSEKIEAGAHTIRTHNNRKRKKAQADIVAREDAYRAWHRHGYYLAIHLGNETYAETSYSLFRHQKPALPWPDVIRALDGSGIDATLFAAGWR